MNLVIFSREQLAVNSNGNLRVTWGQVKSR
jgi:hypothetical protein